MHFVLTRFARVISESWKPFLLTALQPETWHTLLSWQYFFWCHRRLLTPMSFQPLSVDVSFSWHPYLLAHFVLRPFSLNMSSKDMCTYAGHIGDTKSERVGKWDERSMPQESSSMTPSARWVPSLGHEEGTRFKAKCPAATWENSVITHKKLSFNSSVQKLHSAGARPFSLLCQSISRQTFFRPMILHFETLLLLKGVRCPPVGGCFAAGRFVAGLFKALPFTREASYFLRLFRGKSALQLPAANLVQHLGFLQGEDTADLARTQLDETCRRHGLYMAAWWETSFARCNTCSLICKVLLCICCVSRNHARTSACSASFEVVPAGKSTTLSAGSECRARMLLKYHCNLAGAHAVYKICRPERFGPGMVLSTSSG